MSDDIKLTEESTFVTGLAYQVDPDVHYIQVQAPGNDGGEDVIVAKCQHPDLGWQVRTADGRFMRIEDINNRSRLSRPAILRALEAEEILIEPFNPENLNTVSYDVTLGEHYWREKEPLTRTSLYNPYDEDSVRGTWEQKRAKAKLEYDEDHRINMRGIGDQEKVIIVRPGETILAHTQEFIGSRCHDITPDMHGRSSTARNRIKICSDAGFGDIGFHYRWTMEITNLGKAHTVLVVGRRIAQISFTRTEPVEDLYTKHGKYQPDVDTVEALMASWEPEDMLPKQWLDREALQYR